MAEPITLVSEIAANEPGSPEDVAAVKEDLIALRDGLEELGEEIEGIALTPGERGPPGADGVDGKDGRDGNDGADGKDGAAGRDGIDGRDGLPGADGKDGAPGRDGQDGAPGRDGAEGAPGRDGADGSIGPKGEDGEPGRPGRDGVDGRDGRDGEPGERGPPGRDGAAGPPGRDGKDGADGRDGLNGVDGLPGERGPRGEPGRDGKDGDRGPPGRSGLDGKDGAKGDPGFNGLDGAPGAGFTWRGAYQPNAVYSPNDVVRDKGSAWVALSVTSNKPHLEAADWDLMVPRGRAGPAGPQGLPGSGGGGAASEITVTNAGYSNVQEVLDALLYVALTINSFTGGGNFEIGSTVNSVNLAWAYNKAVTSQSINQGIGTLDNADRAEALTSLGLTSNRTWTLSASDGTTPRTATTTVAFLPKRYWGVWADDAPDNTDILTLSQELTSGRAKTVVYDCTGGRFPIYAWPKSFGALSGVTVNNLSFSDYTVTEMSFTNASGHTQDYYVFTFNGIQTGAAISVVFS